MDHKQISGLVVIADDLTGALDATAPFRGSGLSVTVATAPDAFAEALMRWPATGVPANPEAWLLAVARRRAADSHRRRADNRSGRRKRPTMHQRRDLPGRGVSASGVPCQDHAAQYGATGHQAQPLVTSRLRRGALRQRDHIRAITSAQQNNACRLRVTTLGKLPGSPRTAASNRCLRIKPNNPGRRRSCHVALAAQCRGMLGNR